MRPPSIIVLGILSALLSGCVTAGRPKNAGLNAIDPAILRGQANALHYYTRGEPSVRIVAIDDQKTAPFASKHHVSPGRRMVTVDVLALSFRPFGTVTAVVALEFQAGKRYRLTAQKAGGAFDLMFWDESHGTEKRTLLTTSRVGGKYANVAATDSAILRASNANSLGYYPREERHVHIIAIDGQTISPTFARAPDIHAAPGRRIVTVEVRGSSAAYAKAAVELEFQAGKTYGLTACEVNHDFDLMFWIESPGTETHALLTTTRLRGRKDTFNGALLVFLLIR